jgi:hypothetical protein
VFREGKTFFFHAQRFSSFLIWFSFVVFFSAPERKKGGKSRRRRTAVEGKDEREGKIEMKNNLISFSHNRYVIFIIISLLTRLLISNRKNKDDEPEGETPEPPKIQEYSYIEVRVITSTLH